MSIFGRKKSLLQRGGFQGATDWHSHILPGVDDGVQAMEESLEILKKYEEWGVSTLWLTPHIMEDYPNTPEVLQEKFTELKAAYSGPVQLRLAAEHMLDQDFLGRLASGMVMPLGDERNMLLVETSYYNPPIDLYGMLDEVRKAGYYPVLAHPERYEYMEHDDYLHLTRQGVKLQLNLFSLTGFYGTTARHKALKLRKEGLYSFTGTDVHSYRVLLHEAEKEF